MLCMFTMMNQARLGVGLEGVGIADRAYQQALAFAQERKQGRGVGKKGRRDGRHHRASPTSSGCCCRCAPWTARARSICYATAVALDVAARAKDAKVRADAAARGALLTPVAKAFSTDIGNEVTYPRRANSRRYGLYRGGPAPPSTIAMRASPRSMRAPTASSRSTWSLRKLAANGGAFCVGAARRTLRHRQAGGGPSNDPAFGTTGAKLHDALGSLERASKWLLERVTSAPNDALAGATPHLRRLFSSTLGGCMLAGEALAAKSDGKRPAAIRNAT